MLGELHRVRCEGFLEHIRITAETHPVLYAGTWRPESTAAN